MCTTSKPASDCSQHHMVCMTPAADIQLPAPLVPTVLLQVKKFFRPEFLNRLDDIVTFDPLSQDQLLGVARLMAEELNVRLAPKNITLSCTDAALHYAVSQAYDPSYGARPLRRWLEHTIITDLSRMIIAGELPENSTVTCDMDAKQHQLTYKVEAKPIPAGFMGLNGAGGSNSALNHLKRQLEPMGSDVLDAYDDMEA